jgi:hypothetical protein
MGMLLVFCVGGMLLSVLVEALGLLVGRHSCILVTHQDSKPGS